MSGQINPEYAAELASILRRIAESQTGSTHMNGEIVSFKFVLRVAANQIERFAAEHPSPTPEEQHQVEREGEARTTEQHAPATIQEER